MTEIANYSVIVDRTTADVWDIVRDFNSYPIWVNGVEESHIEDELSGTAVGGVRNFAGRRAHQAAPGGAFRRRPLLHLRELCGLPPVSRTRVLLR